MSENLPEYPNVRKFTRVQKCQNINQSQKCQKIDQITKMSENWPVYKNVRKLTRVQKCQIIYQSTKMSENDWVNFRILNFWSPRRKFRLEIGVLSH